MAAPKAISGMTNRQKVTTAIFVIVVLILLWMVYDMFLAGPDTTPETTTAAPGIAAPVVAMPTPKAALLPKQSEPLTPREALLVQLQQETEMKYLSALNQLQMLKIEREIAETNQAIASAKLSTVTAQKNTLNLLRPQPPAIPANYAQGLVTPRAIGASTDQGLPGGIKPPGQEANYSVISVSLLRSEWSAVVGYQGSLYKVQVGDVLPPDGSKVLAIDRRGIILERDGARRTLSMVPII